MTWKTERLHSTVYGRWNMRNNEKQTGCAYGWRTLEYEKQAEQYGWRRLEYEKQWKANRLHWQYGWRRLGYEQQVEQYGWRRLAYEKQLLEKQTGCTVRCTDVGIWETIKNKTKNSTVHGRWNMRNNTIKIKSCISTVDGGGNVRNNEKQSCTARLTRCWAVDSNETLEYDKQWKTNRFYTAVDETLCGWLTRRWNTKIDEKQTGFTVWLAVRENRDMSWLTNQANAKRKLPSLLFPSTDRRTGGRVAGAAELKNTRSQKPTAYYHDRAWMAMHVPHLWVGLARR